MEKKKKKAVELVVEVVLVVLVVVEVVYAMVSCPGGGVSGNRSTSGTVSPGVPGVWLGPRPRTQWSSHSHGGRVIVVRHCDCQTVTHGDINTLPVISTLRHNINTLSLSPRTAGKVPTLY